MPPRINIEKKDDKKSFTTLDLMLVEPGKREVYRGRSWANDKTDRRFYPAAKRRILQRVDMDYSFSNIASMVLDQYNS